MENKSLGLVSLITPTYNCGKFIGETIASVRQQTYTNWEMIIIDDCSSDETSKVVAQYNDDRIRYYCLSRNSGASVARNFGIEKARGKWIAFLDSDDIWSENKLERQLNFMNEKNISFSYTQYEIIDEKGHSIGINVSGPRKITQFGMFAYCWPGCLTVMYNQAVLGLIQIKPIKKNNDYAMWLKIIKKTNCYLLEENLAKYRKREGSISNANYFVLIRWHYKLFRNIEGCSIVRAYFFTIINIVCGIYKKIFYIQKK